MLLPWLALLLLLVVGIAVGVFFEGRQHCFRWMAPAWVLIVIILWFLTLALEVPFPDFSGYFSPRIFKIFFWGLFAIVVFSAGVFLGDLYEERA